MRTPVCLIIPPSAFLLDERVFLSLGILKVAAALEARSVPVQVLDLSGVANFEEAAAAHAHQTAAEHFCLTATTPQMPAAARISDVIRRERPDALQVIGGPHPTVTAAAVKKETARGVQGRAVRALQDLQDRFDVVVAGDGEDSIVEALRQPRKSRVGSRGALIDADDPKGLLFLSKKRISDDPYPARHLVDLDSYRYTIDGMRATSLVAQLGCPFNCGFCSGRASPMLRRARIRTTESTLAEVEHLYLKYGYRGFMFYDDEMNVNKQMVELMRGMVALQWKHGVKFSLRGFVKAELFTQEQADVMAEAGFRWLLCGFESGSPRILDNINKQATVDDNDRAVEFARRAGLKTKALMSLGHAGESPETIEETKQWLLRLRPDDFDATVITPYPGSPYFDDSVQEGAAWVYTAPRSGDRLFMHELDYMKEADYYKGKPGGGYISHVWTDYITPDLLVLLRDQLEDDVRAKLGIPYNAGAPGVQFEASMGQTRLPSNILRESAR